MPPGSFMKGKVCMRFSASNSLVPLPGLKRNKAKSILLEEKQPPETTHVLTLPKQKFLLENEIPIGE